MSVSFYLVFSLIIAYGQAYKAYNVYLDYARAVTDLSDTACNHDRSFNLDASHVVIKFFDFQNHVNITSRISVAVHGVYSYYTLDTSRKLTVFIPDYPSDTIGELPHEIKQTFKNNTDNYLIMIDYSYYTNDQYITTEELKRSIQYSYYIGQEVGILLADIHSNGFPSDNIQVIGFGLGGQIASYVGEAYLQNAEELFGKITAIDPIGPCFEDRDDNDQVRAGLAKYVEVYHCNSGDLATTSVLGDVDFFFNGGKDQPPCRGIKHYIALSSCSHYWCLKYYLKSVIDSNLYVARACDSDTAFEEGSCEDTEAVQAGYYNPGDARGAYYICTIHENQ